MGKRFRTGDRVAWDTPQGETHGVVERRLTSETHVKGHKAAATPIIRSTWSGATKVARRRRTGPRSCAAGKELAGATSARERRG